MNVNTTNPLVLFPHNFKPVFSVIIAFCTALVRLPLKGCAHFGALQCKEKRWGWWRIGNMRRGGDNMVRLALNEEQGVDHLTLSISLFCDFEIFTHHGKKKGLGLTSSNRWTATCFHATSVSSWTIKQPIACSNLNNFSFQVTQSLCLGMPPGSSSTAHLLTDHRSDLGK